MDNKPWYAAGCKGIGRSRKINKDAFLDGSAVGMWCVANGLIGHAKGELASRMIVDYLTRLNCAELFPLSPAQIDQCLHVVNAQLVALAARELPGEIMGSTAAVLILGHAQAHFLWAGDSRVYRLRGNDLCQLSQDHNQLQKTVAGDGTSQHQVRDHPDTHRATGAIGVNKSLEVNVSTSDLQANDIFLLCNDGLISVVEDSEIAFILQTKETQQATQELIQTALERNAGDNVTVITTHYLGSPKILLSAV